MTPIELIDFQTQKLDQHLDWFEEHRPIMERRLQILKRLNWISYVVVAMMLIVTTGHLVLLWYDTSCK